MAPLPDILRPEVVTKAISQIAEASSHMLTLFGMNPGGSKLTGNDGKRQGSYDVFNHTRTVGTGTHPGAPANVIPKNPVGNVAYVIPQLNEEIPLEYDFLNNLRPIGKGPGQYDDAGTTYITKQEKYMAERCANFRTVALLGMLRGALYGHLEGQKIHYTYDSSGAAYTVDFQMPAGNKDRLNMLGAGNIIDASWALNTTNIPLQLDAINAAFQQLCGGGLDTIICNHVTWNHLVNNDYIATQGGTSHKPFDEYEKVIGQGPDGTPINVWVAKLRSKPYKFIVTDEGLELGSAGTFTKHVPDTHCYFLPDPMGDQFEGIQGGKFVVEKQGGPATLKEGMYSWAVPQGNPARVSLFTQDLFLPANYVPKSYAFGNVVF